ncbi:MAG TPA: SET domain-containing protein-lysine N-methyltransferase [Puia sp.]|nr:SET domain-containing protein-lysine N-methyltransferase [Puia sp.]
MISPNLYIAKSPKRGRGIFTGQKIAAGETIEISPVIVMDGADRQLLDQTLLHDYIFEWGAMQGQCCVALGYISIYNHSFKPNCEYFMDYADETIAIKTMQGVDAGEELFINYLDDKATEKSLWFEVS